VKSFRWPKDREAALVALARQTGRFAGRDDFITFALGRISCSSTAHERDAALELARLWQRAQESGQGERAITPEKIVGVLRRARQFLAEGDPEQAHRAFAIAFTAAQRQPDSLENTGMVVQALSGLVHSKIDGGHVEDAAQIVENLLAPDPALPIGLALQARVRIAQGRFADAEAALRRLPSAALQDRGTLADLTLVLAKQGKLDDARAVAAAAVEAYPEDPSLLISLFSILTELDRLDEAERLLPVLTSLISGESVQELEKLLADLRSAKARAEPAD
jgi:tetratricopeptide (TPR) repeat protein